MPRLWREDYSEGEDYDLEWNLREKYSSKGQSPRGRGRRRLKSIFRDSDDEDDRGRRRLKGLLRDLDDEDDRGRLRYSRPYFAGTEVVIAPGAQKPAPAPECKYKCCPCHAEKLAATCAGTCAGQHMICHPVPAKACDCKPAEKKPEKPRIVVDVEDRTDGPMAQRYGGLYRASIAADATVNDIISMLTPDRHRHKILVKWAEGFTGELESITKIEDLKHYARRLVVTKRKRVHYGEVPAR